ncbi:MAG: GNAT family N-acetyltransferase [Gammaproteobacteria bacterium]|nr:GNAT family N-acetyltransferase [Gammaproteobacteria bacterium]MDH4253488.1 GNAT family N-acetyltransferase [Gammaproteobacteria bacterium]MDH5309721.1 GNAT family N-acetyltransferase [Gammaproteobacteria bacterium]
MSEKFRIRPATEADAPALLAVYAPFVEDTVVSFEDEVPSLEDFAGRIRKSLSRWQWLVAEAGNEVAGYAYGGPFHQRAGYRWSVEVSVYLDPRFHRRGIGRALYERLLAELTDMGYCMAYAGVTLPNDASVALHREFGFEWVGTYRRAGRKFGAWHDVGWMQLELRDLPLRSRGRPGVCDA